MSAGKTALRYIIFANLLPLFAIVFIGLDTSEAMFAYYIEITLLITLYSTFILFASRDPQLEIREYTARAVAIPAVSSRSGWAQPISCIPPINFWNVQFVSWPLLLGILFWLCSGTLFIDLLNPTPTLQGGRLNSPGGEYVTVVATAASWRAFGLAILVFAIQSIAIGREFVGRQQYESFSAPELAEIPSQIAIYWFTAVFVLALLLVVTWLFSGNFDPTLYTEIRVISIFLVLKLILDWSLIRIQRQNEPLSPMMVFTFGWKGPKNPDG